MFDAGGMALWPVFVKRRSDVDASIKLWLRAVAVFGSLSVLAGREAGRVLAARDASDRPDAVFCANDLLAVAAMKELSSRGIRVPDEVAVVGMDDTDIAELANPSITSVDLGSVKRARAAAKLLIRRLENPDAPVEQVVIKPSLTVRESTPSAPTPHP